MKNARLLLAAALAATLTLGLSAVASAGSVEKAAPKATAELYELAGSGVTGKARISEGKDGTTRIVVKLRGALSDEPMPTHVHPGTYQDGQFAFDPAPAYHLDDAVNGKSVTMLDVPFREFVANDYLIAAHRPAAEGSGEEYGAAVVAGPVVTKGAE